MARSHTLCVDGDDLARFDLAIIRCANDVERARLRREDECLAQTADHEGAPTARITGDKHRTAHRDDERVRAFHTAQGFREALG